MGAGEAQVAEGRGHLPQAQEAAGQPRWSQQGRIVNQMARVETVWIRQRWREEEDWMLVERMEGAEDV